uniref:Guanylin n=1 Tax=Pogona vitticeps TaxID=103695 RepID=A0A6J0V556_9SAUR
MNIYLTVTLCLSALLAISDGVTVTVDDFSVSLESVKQLKVLLDAEPRNPRFRSSRYLAVCTHPQLPAEIAPVCSSSRAPSVFQKLEFVARDATICEICAYVACSGC